MIPREKHEIFTSESDMRNMMDFSLFGFPW